MKKHFYLAVLVALMSITLNISSVKAEANHREPQRGGSPATCLPINNNIVFLAAAGVIIGIVVVVRRKAFKSN